MKRITLSALVLLAGCGGAATLPAPLDSVALQRISREEAARFRGAVEREAASVPRLAMTSLSASVWIDRPRGRVWILGPTLLSLDLASGAVRFRDDTVRGSALARWGRTLVVVGGEPKAPVTWSLAPDDPHPKRCALRVPAPPQADEIRILPFDRSDGTYALWQSEAHIRRGGTPPTPGEEAHYAAGRACGVVAIDVATCATRAVRLRDFLLDPPRREPSAPDIDPTDCQYLSPDQALPAAAAAQPAPERSEGTPRISIDRTTTAAGCVDTVDAKIVARDASGAELWSHPLPSATVQDRCPGPP